MWLTPFYIFIGLLIVYLLKPSIKLNRLKNFISIFIIFFLFSPFSYGYVSIIKTDKRTDYNGKKIADEIEKEWKLYTKDKFKLSSVIGDEWVAGNLSYHLASRPKWYDYSMDTQSLDGGFIIVNHPDLNCKSSFFPIFKSIKLEIEGNPCIVMYSNFKWI